MKKACNCWAIIYILAIFLILPLYVENNYFNLIAAKSHIFTAVAVIMLPIGIILFLIAAITKKIIPEKINIMDIMFICFTGISIISCLFSDNIAAAFWGSEGWRIGTFAWICLLLSYLLISRCFVYNHNIWIPIIAINVFIIIIAILQAAGMDPFSMHHRMDPDQVFSYYSTIGNTNWWTGYLCLFAPMTIGFLLRAKTLFSKIIYLFFWGLLSFAMLICAVDGIVFGLGVSAFLLIPLLFKNNKRAETTGWIVFIFGTSLLLYTLLPCFAEKISSVSGIIKKICVPEVGGLLLIIGCTMIIVFRFFGQKIPVTVFNLIIIILEVALSIITVFFLIKTIREYGDYWGTLRGKIWNDSIQIFRDFSIKNKLIGVGPEMQRTLYGGLSEWLGQTVKVSHSEPLQYLLSMGIVGALCWYGIWASLIIGYITFGRGKNGKAVWFIPLIAYFAQAHINSSMTTNLAILFVLFALFRMPENQCDIKSK